MPEKRQQENVLVIESIPDCQAAKVAECRSMKSLTDEFTHGNGQPFVIFQYTVE